MLILFSCVHRTAIEALKVIFNHDPRYLTSHILVKQLAMKAKVLPQRWTTVVAVQPTILSQRRIKTVLAGVYILAADTETDHENSRGVATTPDQDEVDSLSALTKFYRCNFISGSEGRACL